MSFCVTNSTKLDIDWSKIHDEEFNHSNPLNALATISYACLPISTTNKPKDNNNSSYPPDSTSTSTTITTPSEKDTFLPDSSSNPPHLAKEHPSIHPPLSSDRRLSNPSNLSENISVNMNTHSTTDVTTTTTTTTTTTPSPPIYPSTLPSSYRINENQLTNRSDNNNNIYTSKESDIKMTEEEDDEEEEEEGEEELEEEEEDEEVDNDDDQSKEYNPTTSKGQGRVDQPSSQHQHSTTYNINNENKESLSYDPMDSTTLSSVPPNDKPYITKLSYTQESFNPSNELPSSTAVTTVNNQSYNNDLLRFSSSMYNYCKDNKGKSTKLKNY